jgi:Uma2 family endonuclease
MGWLSTYWFATPGIDLFDNATLRLDLGNEPQPDAALCIETAHGGQARISVDDYLEGAPELVVEVAASSAAYDVGDKLKAYQRNGIAEYIVWMIYEQRLEWWQLNDGMYVPMSVDSDGIIRSQVFPGLYLHVASLLAQDRAPLLATLQRGIASAEHAAFVRRLAANR